jgi:hypothetical protein
LTADDSCAGPKIFVRARSSKLMSLGDDGERLLITICARPVEMVLPLFTLAQPLRLASIQAELDQSKFAYQV